MGFAKKREKYCTLEEINNVLEFCKKNRNIKYGPKDGEFRMNAWIEDSMVYFKVTVRDDTNTPCTYIFRKDGSSKKQVTNGCTAYTTMRLCMKGIKINESFSYLSDILSAKPILWYNPKYEGQRIKAIAYDINSAYSSAMLELMPDTTKAQFNAYVEDGYIGFNLDGSMVEEGLADYVFPLQESPFRYFVERWYEKKLKAKNDYEKEKAKEILNFCVGYLQKKDPFQRARIVDLCNQRIADLIDENTLMCNTDCIISSVRRPDIEAMLGTELGSFKIEQEGFLAYKGNNYQWISENRSQVKYRGVPNAWFRDDFDILEDELPKNGNIYYFDEEKIQIKERKYGK